MDETSRKQIVSGVEKKFIQGWSTIPSISISILIKRIITSQLIEH